MSAAVSALHKQVKAPPIQTVFKTSESVLGRKDSGGWTHLSLQVPRSSAAYHPKVLLSARQRRAGFTVDHGLLNRALQRFTSAHARLAAGLLQDDSFKRANHIVPQAQWFLALHHGTAALQGSARTNRIWSAVATAPLGWAHVRSGMLGTVLDDIQ
ncbi:MAG: hypothetical protein ACI9VR_003813, partial [Cognaticolwellia sp.]